MTQEQSITLVIDADMMLYKVTSATEQAVHWGEDLWVLGGNLRESIDLLEGQVDNLRQRFDTNDMIFCITGNENFRKTIDPEYKAHRKSTRKPLLYPQVRQYLMDKYHVECENVLEADDLCGIYSTDPTCGPCVVVSDDKDMYTLPDATIYRQGEVVKVTAEEAWHNWMIQTLTGDATDGYPGCKGYGPVKAAKALAKDNSWGTVVKCFVDAGQTEEDALRNARLSRILHHGDYDFETQQVKLWEAQ